MTAILLGAWIVAVDGRVAAAQESVGVRGYNLGMTRAEVNDLPNPDGVDGAKVHCHGERLPDDGLGQPGRPLDLTGWTAVDGDFLAGGGRVCTLMRETAAAPLKGFRSHKVSHPLRLKVADEEVQVFLHFTPAMADKPEASERLAQITMAFPPNQRSETAAMLTERFGEPSARDFNGVRGLDVWEKGSGRYGVMLFPNARVALGDVVMHDAFQDHLKQAAADRARQRARRF